MSIPTTLDRFLGEAHVPFEVAEHPHTASSHQTARAAHVSGTHLAKGVVIQDKRDGRFFLTVLPAENRLELKWLKEDYAIDPVLVKEDELKALFPDCEPGAVPPFGPAYHLSTIWDERLGRQSDLYLEAGDHEHLVHLSYEAFHRLFEGQPHSIISSRP